MRLRLALGLATFTFAAAAHADVQARAKLTYDVTRARACPTETDLRAAVGARLGYDPFVDPASATEVSVRVESRERAAVGVLEIRGPHPGTREIASPSGDCKEVVDALATAIAISLDPASLTRPPDAPPPPPTPVPVSVPVPVPVPPPAIPPPAPPPPPPRERVHPTFGASAALLLGELPRPAPGVDIWAGATWRFLQATVEGSFAAASGREGAGTVHASLLTAALVPCASYKFLFGCVVGRLGALRGEGTGITFPERASTAYANVAARAGVDVPVYAALSIRAYGELDVPLTRVGLALDGTEVWSSPTLAARFGIGAGLRF